MPSRKRRADKKAHSKHQDDVILALVRSPAWRQALLDLQPYDEVIVNVASVSGQVGSAAELVRRYNLSYVLTVDPDNESGDPCPVEGAKVFKLRAAQHPTVYVYAEELLDAIGRSVECRQPVSD